MEFQLYERMVVCRRGNSDDPRLVLGAKMELRDVFFLVADEHGQFEEWLMTDCILWDVENSEAEKS